MKELYEKIFIKTEADLPNIKDVYYVHIKPDNILREWSYFKESDLSRWLKYIDWYLQPVEQDINTPFFGNSGAKVPMIEQGIDNEAKSADWRSDNLKCIEQEKPESAEEFLQKKYNVEFVSADIKASKKILIECMEEYSSQKHLPTDEEIMQAATKYSVDKKDANLVFPFMDAIWWMRDKLNNK